ncbi:MAG: dipeptide epimerase, partial [candidate division KSB1 bacterium]|nr:dipeptide epimerase [candidate division KSB1 bacterium]
SLSPRLVGQDPFNIEAILALVEEAAPKHPATMAALDMALYDLMGKALQVPVHRLLGGKIREGMSLYPIIFMGEPEEMAEWASQYAELGFTILKLKIGSDPEEDEERVARVREAAGTPIRLRLDVNQGWQTPEKALAAIQRILQYRPELIEQPVAAEDLDGLAEVTAKVAVPIMVDEGCRTPAEAITVVQKGAADIINIKLMKCGGIYRATQINAIAEAAGLPCILGSNSETTIATSAGMHLVAAKTNIYACELFGPLLLKKDIASGFEVDLATGWAKVPQGPGLGVSLLEPDRDVVESSSYSAEV